MSRLRNKINRVLNNIKKQYQIFFYGNCAVLLYHRVTNLTTDPQLLAVSPDNFDSHLLILSKKFHLLTVDEFLSFLKNNKKFPKNSVLITFDDGYADNYLEALPILKKYDAQGLFYIATGTLNTKNEYWWDAVERIVLLSKVQPIEDKFELKGKSYSLGNLNSEKRFKLYEDLLSSLRTMISAERENKIEELAKLFESEEGRETHRAMTFDELKKMDQSASAVIGAHTNLHPSLGALSYDEQMKEIELSKRILENNLNKKINHFSYPFGTKLDFNNDTISICKKLGFELVAANYPYIVHKGSDMFSFPRFLVRDWKPEEFEKNLNAFLN